MDEIKNEKKITIYMDDVPSNYLESITDLSFIGYNIREHKNGIFYIPITPKKLDKYNLLSPTVFIKFPFKSYWLTLTGIGFLLFLYIFEYP